MRHPSGRVSLGGLVLLALIVAPIYLGVLLVPLYIDKLDVKEAVTVAFNRIPSGEDDESLRRTILEHTSRMGSHLERDEFDQEVLKPGMGLTDDNITIERSSVDSSVRIQVDYERTVRFKPTNKVRTLHFTVVKEGIPGQL